MKRFLFGFLAILFLIFNTIPYLHILADQSMTESQLKQVGAFALSSLITTGEATELDFSDYTDTDTDFLLALGELVITGDPSGLFECGLDWLGENIDDAYDSAIQSIRTWEYNNLPDSFYYWFIDENPPYELAPSYNNIRDLSQPLRRLLTPPLDSGSPNPDIDYIPYITTINDRTPQVTPYGTSFFWNSNMWFNSSHHYYKDGVEFTPTNTYPQNFSWIVYDLSAQISTFSNGSYTTPQIMGYDIFDVFINNVNGVYQLTTSTLNNSLVILWGNFGNKNAYNLKYTPANSSQSLPQQTNLFSGTTSFTFSGTLQECFDYLSRKVKNVNIYVNGNAWSIVGDSTPTYPIVIPDQLTIWNDQPLQYEFPSDTYLKLPDLTNIITNAINNSGVVMWSDIADCFVDVNGQTAVAVTKIVRNDYDNLYMEQYPYPAMLVGMTDQTKFNEHLLDNSHAYLSPMNTIVQETVNVLPSELVGVLAIGAILTIFAVIINRLLE